MSNTRFIHRIEGFDLIPGNKRAGFLLVVDTSTLRRLSAVAASDSEIEALVYKARARAERGRIGTKIMRSAMGVHCYNGTCVPRVFNVLSGSVSADPEVFAHLSSPIAHARLDVEVEYTPHNVDAPAEALLLMILVQTWAEWAANALMIDAVCRQQEQEAAASL